MPLASFTGATNCQAHLSLISAPTASVDAPVAGPGSVSVIAWKISCTATLTSARVRADRSFAWTRSPASHAVSGNRCSPRASWRSLRYKDSRSWGRARRVPVGRSRRAPRGIGAVRYLLHAGDRQSRLILVNRSWRLPIWRSFVERRNLTLRWILALAIAVLVLLLSVPALRDAFGFAPMTRTDVLVTVAAGSVSVAWFQVYKLRTGRG